ncbi:MAG: HAD-IA family hydrolase [Acidobacteriota bacterium]
MRSDLRNIKAIFFDAGGTLIHLDSSRIRDLLRLELSIEMSLDRFPRAQSLAMARVAELVAAGAGSTEQLKREFYTTLLPETGVSREKLSDAVDCAFKAAREEMLWRQAEDATAPVLNGLKERRYILGVISNSDGRIESAFQQAGLASYFDFFIDSFNVGVEKPDPRIFHLATERAGVAANEAAYVGDLYPVDVVGARNAGLLPILYDPFELNSKADCLTIRSIDELLTLIR